MSNKNDGFKQEVLEAFQKVSPSAVYIEKEEELKKYVQNLYTLFFHHLKFPPSLFRDKKVLDFGCGTGEVDVVYAKWGAKVKGFDFNNISVDRANGLKDLFQLTDSLDFSVGDVDTFPVENENYDIVCSHGVIAHVPN